MIERRTFLIGTAALAGLAACQPAGPGSATIVAQGAAGMNPGADGSDRPVTLQIVQLRGTGAFDGADYFALQNPAGALGGDLIKADALALAPGGKASKTVTLDPGCVAIGIIAGFVSPGGKAFRAKAAVSPTEASTFAVTVGASGVSLSAA
jgi:type VI secretion system protein VasD